jgi:hypothetical protein
MGKAEKLLKRFLSKPKDFTYDELKKLLRFFGYEEATTGKTSGSRVTFYNSRREHTIKLHRPHPKPFLKRYQLDFIEDSLKEEGQLK